MQSIKQPSIHMSGVQLGFNLSVLTQQLVEATCTLTSVDPSDASLTGQRDLNRISFAIEAAAKSLPTIRARLYQYMAKRCGFSLIQGTHS